MSKIYYRELHKYKYITTQTYVQQLPDCWPQVSTEFISINEWRRLRIESGYAWDGPSGPTWDTKSSLRASLVHDALYQLIRLGKIPMKCKASADELLYTIGAADGMYKWRAWMWYQGVKYVAGFATKSKGEEWPVLSAP